jgi:hypothetical protein
MWAFPWSILVRRVWTGQFHGISKVRKRTMDVATLSELTTSIHADILVGALWRVAGEPAVDPVDGRCLRCEGAAKNPATVVIGQENIARFAIEADESVVSN